MKRFFALSAAIITAFSIGSLVGVMVVLSTTVLFASDGDHVSSSDGIPEWVKSTGIVAGISGGPLFAVWYAYYMTTNRIPALEKIYKEQVEELNQQHVDYIKETNRIHADHIALITNNYRSDVNAMWNIKHEDDKALINALQNLGDRFTCRYLAGSD